MTDTSTEPPPYCSECGYALTGAIESSKCPECGRPLVEILVRDEGPRMVRRRHQSDVIFLGLPLVSVALGTDHQGQRGHAKGWIAIGDIATGVLAIGGRAQGLIAVGGLAIGVLAFGGLGFGLLFSFGGLAIALGLAVGGGAIGGLAAGGLAIGYMALGGYVIAVHGVGGMVIGGRGLPVNVNPNRIMSIVWYVSIVLGIVCAIPGIIYGMYNNRAQRNQD